MDHEIGEKVYITRPKILMYHGQRCLQRWGHIVDWQPERMLGDFPRPYTVVINEDSIGQTSTFAHWELHPNPSPIDRTWKRHAADKLSTLEPEELHTVIQAAMAHLAHQHAHQDYYLDKDEVKNLMHKLHDTL